MVEDFSVLIQSMQKVCQLITCKGETSSKDVLNSLKYLNFFKCWEQNYMCVSFIGLKSLSDYEKRWALTLSYQRQNHII